MECFNKGKLEVCNGEDIKSVQLRSEGNKFDGDIVEYCKGCRSANSGLFKLVKDTPGGKDEKKPTKVTSTEIREYLKYFFTEDEIRNLGKEMAQATIQANEAEEQKKAAMAEFKDKIEKHLLVARQASRFISNGYEMRNIDCIKRIDYANETVTITRKDTGEVVEERKIHDSERQMSF